MMETERKKAATEIVVAIDHGLSFPETVGLERPIDLLRELVSLPEVDGLIATAGMYRQAERNGIDLEQLNRLTTAVWHRDRRSSARRMQRFSARTVTKCF